VGTVAVTLASAGRVFELFKSSNLSLPGVHVLVLHVSRPDAERPANGGDVFATGVCFVPSRKQGGPSGQPAAMDNRIPVVVKMSVECARCEHTEDDTYEFDMPFAKSQPMEAYEPGKCHQCTHPENQIFVKKRVVGPFQ